MSWLRLDSDAKTDEWFDDPAVRSVIPLGDAEASRAIIATNTEVVMARVTTFGKRCAVLPLTI